MKGGAGAIGFHDAAALAHQIEDLLERVADEELEFSEDLRALFRSSIEALGDMVEDDTTTVDVEDLQRRIAEYRSLPTNGRTNTTRHTPRFTTS